MFLNQNNIVSMKNFHQQILNNEIILDENKPNSFISTESTNDPNINPNQKIQKYIFENNNKLYSLFINLFEEKIKITINLIKEKQDDYYYEKDFSQEELKTVNNVFKLCNDIEESYEYFNDLFKEKNNQVIVNESNNSFKIEKKMQISQKLTIEIPKRYKSKTIHNNLKQDLNTENKNNKIKCLKNVSPLKDKNDDIEKKLDLLEKDNEKIIELVKNNFIQNEEKFNKISQNIIQIDNMINNSFISKKKEEKKNLYILLNRKRGSMSDLSDISFNSNDNNEINKKNKNNLEKEKFLKIFSDNNSINSEISNEKFFMKILKKKKLNEENNNLEKKSNNNINEINNNKEEENETYLYGDKDFLDDIKDDIDFFSSKSPSITKGGVSINYVNNKPSLYLNNENKSKNSLFYKENNFNDSQNLFPKNNNNLNLISNYNSNKQNKIENNKNKLYEKKISSEWTVNNSYNMIGGLLEKNYYNKKINKKTSYRIINKNSIESCNVDFYKDSQNKNKYFNNIFSVDSKIISDYREFDFIINYLKNKFNKEIINSIRIYRATEEGDRAEDFHRFCDGNTNVIVLIKTKNGKKIGGYTSVGFNNLNQSIADDTAFIFSIDKREIYPNIKGKNAIESYNNLGPTFSGDIIKIYDNFLQKGGITSKIGSNYQTNEDFQINDGIKFFGVEEIEVLEFLEMKIDNYI